MGSYDNGKWGHIGYVLDVDNYLTNGYYDYFVAQHTSNYLAWTSTDQYSWEDQQENDNNMYDIIRK